ncbi:hypothetical protein ABIB80_004544 [Bradyrhizobium sp. i1.15.2]|uniref:hypothetical protein n=1 Tax=Bradyrhizobium sp. i1.15.2 TaxID=3156362 RepID=UPI003391F11C
MARFLVESGSDPVGRLAEVRGNGAIDIRGLGSKRKTRQRIHEIQSGKRQLLTQT